MFANIFKHNETWQNIYFGVMARKSRGGKTNRDAAPGRSAWVDFDHMTPEQAMDRILEKGLPRPTLHNNSGRGAHSYWVFREKHSVEEITQLCGDLAEYLGSDPSVKNAGRLLRLPGTRNVKDPASPCPCYLCEVNPKVDFDEFRAMVPAGKGNRADKKEDGDLEEMETGRIREGRRNKSLFKHGIRLRKSGLNEETIFADLQKFNAERCEPPVEETEVKRIAKSAASYPTRDDESPFDDLANARRFAEDHKSEMRYLAEHERWFHFNGRLWVPDDLGIERLAKETVQGFRDQAAKCKDPAQRQHLQSRHRYTSKGINFKQMISLARSEPNIEVHLRQLDVDPMLLNVLNGTIDLTTGRLREHSRDDFLSMTCNVKYDEAARCPQWETVIAWAMNGDPEHVAWMQRFFGYAATGRTDEQALFFWLGEGANAKTTILEAFRALLADYAARTPTETLLSGRGDKIRDDLERLRNKRLVTASEIPKGRNLDEALVKDITGGDMIAARPLYGKYGEFIPAFKLVVLTNYLPRIGGRDQGIWRRVRVVPFKNVIAEAERDSNLPRKLLQELSGLLNWTVEGCLQWQRIGLRTPPEFEHAVQAYREEMDVAQHFLGACCELRPGTRVPKSDLYAAYVRWCHSRQESEMSKNEFGAQIMRLVSLGRILVNEKHSDGTRFWGGIELRKDWDLLLK